MALSVSSRSTLPCVDTPVVEQGDTIYAQANSGVPAFLFPIKDLSVGCLCQMPLLSVGDYVK